MTSEERRRWHVAEWGMHVGDVLTFPSCVQECQSPRHRGVLVVKYRMVGHPVGIVNLLCCPGKQTCIGLRLATLKGRS